MIVTVVYNPRSGSAISRSRMQLLFKNAGVNVDGFIAINDRLPVRLAPYIKKGRIIAAIGGDGTISSVAGLVAHTKASLLPLPGGTLNHFTKDLGVIQNLEEAIANSKHGSSKRIDGAILNGKYFINNSSIGIYPSSLARRNSYESTIGKWPAALLAMGKVLIRWPLLTVTINDQTFSTPFIFVGNNVYDLAEIGIATRDSLTAGVLSVIMAKTSSRKALAKVMIASLLGRHRTTEEFEVVLVKDVTIHSRRRLVHVSRDGELNTEALPLTYQCDQKALNVWIVHT